MERFLTAARMPAYGHYENVFVTAKFSPGSSFLIADAAVHNSAECAEPITREGGQPARLRGMPGGLPLRRTPYSFGSAHVLQLE